MSDKDFKRKIKRLLLLDTLVMVTIAFLASIIVDVAVTIRLGEFKWQNIFMSLGIIIPMCAIMAVYQNFHFRTAVKHIENINAGLNKIAGGDLSVNLETAGSGALCGIYENINKMVAELRSAEKMKDDFINSYSHEFKTPVASINGFADLLLNHSPTDEEMREYLQIIYEESKRLERLANNSILMAKLQNQTIVDDKAEFRLDRQLKQCGIELSGKWEAKKINFSGEYDTITYYGNKDLLKQVWLNLIDNAIKYTPENGDITVTLKKCTGGVECVVKDSGIGIKKEQLQHIFDRYYQSDNSGKNGGTGLGLPIAKRIVELCGGTIEVGSVPDEVTAFTVKLPI